MVSVKNGTTAGRALVEGLHCRGVDRIFCVPGESFLDVLDALYDYPDIQVVVAKHEGAAANMAEADGKLTGRPGICFVTRGPGACHGAIGVHIAAQDSTPMIMFVGQVALGDRGRDCFQEIDYRAMFGSVAKWVTELDDCNRVDEVLQRAFHVATTGRPGPVVISLPEDMLSALCEGKAAKPGIHLDNGPSPADLRLVVEKLAAAERPLVLLGGTGWTASGLAAFQAFVEKWDLPVAATFRHQDQFDNRHPNYVGHLALGVDPHLAALVRSADLIIALGTRLGDVATGGYQLLDVPYPSQFLVHVYPSGEDIGRVYRADIGMATSPAAWAESIAGFSPESPPKRLGYTTGAREAYLRFSEVPVAHADLTGVNLANAVRVVSDRLGAGGIVTNGAGNYTSWVHRFFAYKTPKTCLAPTNGSMGYGLPAAIAAKLRYPEREVVCFAGDGCFLMYAQELATAAQYGAAVIVIIVNNGMYGTIRMYQENRFPGRIVGTELASPDFVMHASAFGATAERVDNDEAFSAAFARAQAARGLYVIELITDPLQITPGARMPASASNT